jgi:ATP-dependent helicase/DNAse subunit B
MKRNRNPKGERIIAICERDTKYPTSSGGAPTYLWHPLPDSKQELIFEYLQTDEVQNQIRCLELNARALSKLPSLIKCNKRNQVECVIHELLGLPLPEWSVERTRLEEEIQHLMASHASSEQTIQSKQGLIEELTARVEELAQDKLGLDSYLDIVTHELESLVKKKGKQRADSLTDLITFLRSVHPSSDDDNAA